MLMMMLAVLSPVGVVLESSSTDDGLSLGIDARLSLVASDDNLAVGSGLRSSTGLFTAPAARLSFEDVERQDVAYDRDLRLMLLGEHAETSGAPGFYLGLLPRLSLVDPNASTALGWSDTASFFGVRKGFAFGELALTAFPLSGDQIRLGYTNDASWAIGARANGVAPGARIEWSGFGGYGFVGGVSFSRPMNQKDGTKEFDTAWSVLSGVGWRLFDMVNVDVEGTYALRGTIDKQELTSPTPGADPAAWRAYGGAARLAWSDGIAVATPVAYTPLDNDLFVFDSLMTEDERPRERLSWSTVGTTTFLWQTLQDPDEPTALVKQRALVANFISRVQYNRVGGALLASYRDLAFVLFDVPSNPSFVGFPASAKTAAETRLAARGWIGWRVGDVEAKTALDMGIRWPASLRARTSQQNPVLDQVIVFNDANETEILDVGERARPVPEIKASLQARFNEWATAVVDLLGRYDRNDRTFFQDASGIPIRRSVKPSRFGVNFLFRARI